MPVRAFLDDLLTRAFHTLWQTAAPLAVVLWTASGLSLGQLASVDGRQKAYVAIVVPLAAACLSALKTTALAYFKANRPEIIELTEEELSALHVNMGFLEPAPVATPVVDPAPVSPNAIRAGAVVTGDPA